MEIRFEINAFAKVILHAAKYPSFPVNGFLIRKISKEKFTEGTSEIVHCEDTIPLTHIPMSKFCTPTLEIALAQVEQHCKNSKSEVVGYYQANQDIQDNKPDFIAGKLAEKLQESRPNLVVVMLENDVLDSNLEKIPFVAYRFGGDGKLKVHDATMRLLPDDQGSLSTVSALIQAKAYRQLVDFDNHLDDIRQNYWTNSKVTETIQQFTS